MVGKPKDKFLTLQFTLRIKYFRLEVVTEREDQQTFVGKRHLVSFLSWLDYCDQLTGIANPIVAEALARTVQQKFLIPCVQQSLLQA